MLTKFENITLPEKLGELLIPHLDYTNLDEKGTEKDIQHLCERASATKPFVAAVCVFPHFVKQCKDLLIALPIKIATVINFPQGNDPLETSCTMIEESLHHGANEIDLVLPYQTFLQGDFKKVGAYLQNCASITKPHAQLKVILETGELKTASAIRDASFLALDCGADFLKTSTGKVPIGASLEAAEVMLQAIKKMGSPAGFKASGGVKTPREAYEYFLLTETILEKKPTAALFRIGASRLLDELS